MLIICNQYSKAIEVEAQEQLQQVPVPVPVPVHSQYNNTRYYMVYWPFNVVYYVMIPGYVRSIDLVTCWRSQPCLVYVRNEYFRWWEELKMISNGARVMFKTMRCCMCTASSLFFYFCETVIYILK